MAIHCPRIYYQNLRYFLITIILGVFVLSFISLGIQNNLLDSYETINQTVNDYKLETTDFYPHLPIQIFTNNRQKFLDLKNKTKKLILIGTPFFDDRTWTIKSLKNRTSSANFSELHCSFVSDYCELTRDQTHYSQADAVVYHLRDRFNLSTDVINNRRSSQRFVMTLWEPPINTPDLRSLKNFFNWSMTYRFDSHIFAPYFADDSYRLKSNKQLDQFETDFDRREVEIFPHKNIDLKKKKGTVAALISNCGPASNRRWYLILELQKYIDVTVYGKCGHPCPKSHRTNANECRKYLAENYYFVLSFENSYCQDYVTEKFFRLIKYPIVPVVFGQANYSRYIPSSGFIDVRQFPNIEELANRLNEIKSNSTLYEAYFHWKNDFQWGGFLHFMSPFCDLCLRLHLDKQTNVINDIHQWWFHETCQPESKDYFVIKK